MPTKISWNSFENISILPISKHNFKFATGIQMEWVAKFTKKFYQNNENKLKSLVFQNMFLVNTSDAFLNLFL